MSGSPKAENEKDGHHSIVIAYWRSPTPGGELYFLMGKESVYSKFIEFKEKMTEAEQENYVRDLIKYDRSAKFTLRTSKKRRVPGYTIQRLGETVTYGFPKGGSEPEDKNPKDTAVREFEEEVGYKLNKDKLQDRGQMKDSKSYLYTYMVDDDTKKKIEDKIQELEDQRMGELFDTKFHKAEYIKTLTGRSINKKSKEAFDFVRKMVDFRGGASRKNKNTRKSRQTRKRLRVKG